MKGISSKAADNLENLKLFNGNELQHQEFSDGGGLETIDFNHRMYDAQVGRFWQQDPIGEEAESWSPYTFTSDNPILRCDPTGLADSALNQSHPTILPTAFKNVKIQKPGISTAAIAIPFGFGSGVGAGTFGGTTATVSATGIGLVVAGSVVQVVIGELTRRLTNERYYVTYYKRGRNGEIYVGRCSGFGSSAQDVLEKYDRSHRMNSLGYGDAILDKSVAGSDFAAFQLPGSTTQAELFEVSGYAATRGREQQLYDDFKLKGFTMGNSINPVWKYNILAETYWAASTVVFHGALQPFGATY